MDKTGVPKLLWTQVYSDRVESNYHEFIDDLGRKWFKFLGTKVDFTVPKEETSSMDALIPWGFIPRPLGRNVFMIRHLLIII